MEINVGKIAKTSLKVAGAACAAVGVVAASAIVASGAAVGSVAEGFVQAKKAANDILKKDENYTPIASVAVVDEDNNETKTEIEEIKEETEA